MLLPTTLSLAAAAIVINLWISMRIGKLRVSEKVLHGDGGKTLLAQRMRAHANFIENTPLVLIVIGAIEATGRGGQWLALIGAAFMLGRVLHVIGMDYVERNKPRMLGTVISFITQIALAAAALLAVFGQL